MNYIVELSPRAEDDAVDAYEYYEEKRYGLGQKFIDNLYEVLSQLEKNPRIFQKIKGEIRRALLPKFPFAIFYRVGNNGKIDVVTVFRIRHQSSDPDKWP